MMQDFRLDPRCPAVDAGEIIPGLSDRYSGRAPELGAAEPHYGPRPIDAQNP